MTLEEVIAATKAGGFVYTSPEFHAALVLTGTVEIKEDMVDNHGNIATRAILKENTMTQDTQVKPTFEIKSGDIPARVRKVGSPRAGRTPIYPFADLEIGQYFFVPNKSEDRPAVKALASTVNGANQRYSEVVEGSTRTNRKGNVVPMTVQTRKFKLFDSEEDGVKGAKVFRVALEG